MHKPATAKGSIAKLLPIMAMVFVAFLMIGLALPVLPLHVHQGLGLGAFAVGLVAGSQFAASLISRMWAGHYADGRGPKRSVVAGLLGAAIAGTLYLVSLRFVDAPLTSVSILLLGRALLGGAESFIITGALSWGLALMGADNTGKVMALVGAAMYAAFALGAPAGTLLYTRHGFAAIALTTTLAPLATSLLVVMLRPVAVPRRARPALTKIVGAVWIPGLGLAFSSVGFGAITAFIALLFVARAWSPAWLAFTAFAIAFMLARVVFGHLPDKLGGARVAMVCVLIEATGQAMIWLAPGPTLALTGAVLTGLGYSLVYPSLGVEAVRRAPAQSLGLAMGAYTAFLDLALAISSPLLGLIGSGAGIGTVFLASTMLVLCSAAIVVWLLLASLRSETAVGLRIFNAGRRGACVQQS